METGTLIRAIRGDHAGETGEVDEVLWERDGPVLLVKTEGAYVFVELGDAEPLETGLSPFDLH